MWQRNVEERLQGQDSEHHQLQKVDALQPLRLCPQRKGHSETGHNPDDQHQG